jgi:hypothetical protein
LKYLPRGIQVILSFWGKKYLGYTLKSYSLFIRIPDLTRAPVFLLINLVTLSLGAAQAWLKLELR